MITTNKRLKAALGYAGRGWRVVPVHNVKNGACSCKKGTECPPTDRGKHPRTENGTNDGTTGAKIIRDWWRKMPRANVGVVTGIGSNLLVLDCDSPNAFEGLKAENPDYDWESVPRYRTGRPEGGCHLLFSCRNTRIKSATKVLPHIDVRANGAGMAVMPPSRHDSGKFYIWEVEPQASLPDLPDELESQLQRASQKGSDEYRDPWLKVTKASDFINESQETCQSLVRDFLFPESITMLSAPRGLGESHVAIALGSALAAGGRFRGEKLDKARVLVVDRDNPAGVVKERLKSWGAAELKLLTRKDAPRLDDAKAWSRFPVNDYDAVIIDSVGSSTEGITEKEGKETTKVLATLLDVARKGPAILLLNNTVKLGGYGRGRGEWADRCEIVYEARDATGLKPSGKKRWWQELADAGEGEWSTRAARRSGQTSFRIAFVTSKFRLGPDPDPFCLQLDLPADGAWKITDVTEELTGAARKAVFKQRKEKERKEKYAADLLLDEITRRDLKAEAPILKTEAEDFLRAKGRLKVREARAVIAKHDDSRWQLRELKNHRGGAKAIFPLPSPPKKKDNKKSFARFFPCRSPPFECCDSPRP